MADWSDDSARDEMRWSSAADLIVCGRSGLARTRGVTDRPIVEAVKAYENVLINCWGTMIANIPTYRPMRNHDRVKYLSHGDIRQMHTETSIETCGDDFRSRRRQSAALIDIGARVVEAPVSRIEEPMNKHEGVNNRHAVGIEPGNSVVEEVLSIVDGTLGSNDNDAVGLCDNVFRIMLL